MDAKVYLKSFGWTEGEALRKGGLKKPILVKHKKDTKGLGHDSNNADMWWEKLFDGQLKNLEVDNGSGANGVSFKHNNETVLKTLNKNMSPLYRMFVKGKGLEGTVGKKDHTKVAHVKDLASKAAEDMEKLTSTVQKKSKKEKVKTTTRVDAEDGKTKKGTKESKEKLKKKRRKESTEKELRTDGSEKTKSKKRRKQEEEEEEEEEDASDREAKVSKDKKRRKDKKKEKKRDRKERREVELKGDGKRSKKSR
ncbi:hypothetical protein CANMA_002925 [Candida margitis]|uniref:uncharacterized protein n=1 Tax=Candida margitis TaxID=1775924 RepID=UPI002227FAFF|nr:uncharacterized protein CANMA_002925 [Candida margitis]KAI5967745.1 hypothetical protein CANMA_002925 [Candida margitis]